VIGGLFIVLAGLLILVVAALLSSFSGIPLPSPISFTLQGLQDFATLLGGVEVILGLAVIVCAVLLNAHPEGHVMWGSIIMLFSLVSIVGSGGFIIGLVLGFAGGLIAVIWKPPSPVTGGALMYGQPPYQPPGYGQPGYPIAGYRAPYQQYPANPPAATAQARTCPRCGAPVNPGAAFCSSCGSRL